MVEKSVERKTGKISLEDFRFAPSDVANFQKKVRALSCYTVVPLCRKQSIKEVSLY